MWHRLLMTICLGGLLLGFADPGVVLRGLSDEEIKAAETLMSQHLPEVRDLVEVLRKRAPKEYEKAIRDLARSNKRLESLKKRDQILFNFEVELLRAQVQIDIATAHLLKQDKDSLRKELKRAIDERSRLRIAKLERQKELLVVRQGQTDKEIDQLTHQLEKQKSQLKDQTQKEFDQILRRTEQSRQRSNRGET